jgi:pilus assembly protein Flp/PilA
MKTLFNRFVNDESGATAIEYGLLAALIAVAIIATLRVLGTNLNARFDEVADALAGAAPAP